MLWLSVIRQGTPARNSNLNGHVSWSAPEPLRRRSFEFAVFAFWPSEDDFCLRGFWCAPAIPSRKRRMLNALSTLCKFFTSLALILAIAAIGFAHSNARKALSPELAAYVAEGGSLADICGGTDKQNSAHGQKCEACRLIGAALMPRNCYGVPLLVSDQTRILTFVAKRLHRARPLDPTRLTRAPPKA